MHYVVYMGGTCGDLVSAVIDNRGNSVDGTKIQMQVTRALLKKPYIFKDSAEKLRYLDEIKDMYTCIPSHDVEFHIEQVHDIIGIAVETEYIANWCAERFKAVHRPAVWEQVCKSMNIETVNDYAEMLLNYSTGVIKPATNNIITVEEILDGKLCEKLHSFGIDTLDEELYNNWINAQWIKDDV